MYTTDTIFVAGAKGLVGSALVRQLNYQGFHKLLTPSTLEVDLSDQKQTHAFFAKQKPNYVFLAAAKVGGILANNTSRYDFIYKNLAIAANVVEAARVHGTKRLLFLGSSCIYPKLCPQPMKEEHLLTSALEPTNEPYAIAKIAGVKLVEACNAQYKTDFLSCMPTNLYGPNDNFDLTSSHVLPAMIRKFHEAKANNEPVTVWGSGSPRREFLHVDDAARAMVTIMNRAVRGQFKGDLINIGCGKDVSIKELALLVQKAVGHTGSIVWDASKPDGTPQKLLNVDRLLSFGWTPSVELSEGIKHTYQWLLGAK